MKTLQLLLSTLILLFFYNISFAQIDQSYFYDRGYEEFDPRSIEPTLDNGYIVSGILNYSKAFIMKVDSAFVNESYKEIEPQWGTPENFSENLTRFTDSSFLFVHSSWDPDNSTSTLSLYELDQSLNVLKQADYNLGYEPIALNALKISDDNCLIATTGLENIILSVDSMLELNWAKRYISSEDNFKLTKIEHLSDSLIFATFIDDFNINFSTLTNEGEIVNTTKVNLGSNKPSIIDVEVSYNLDTLCLLYNREGTNNCHFIKMNKDLEIYNEYVYAYRVTEFATRSNVGFIRADSLGFIFYAGNSLFQSNRNHELLYSLGDYITFKDYYINDTTTLLLVKNGLTPVKQAAQGSEFVILSGNSIDTIMKDGYSNECLYMSYLYSLPGSYVSDFSPADIDAVNYSNVTLVDSIHLIEYDINFRNGCPEVPWSTENTESFSIEIYPNPANNVLNISSDKEINEIVFYSVAGSVVESRDVHSRDVSIDISGLNPGMYFLGVFVGDEYIMKKIVVE